MFQTQEKCQKNGSYSGASPQCKRPPYVPAQGFMSAIGAFGENSCPHIAKENRQHCWDTYSGPFGDFMVACEAYFNGMESVEPQVVAQEESTEADPCFTKEQYIGFFAKSMIAGKTGAAANLECAKLTMGITFQLQADAHCSTFMELLNAEGQKGGCTISPEKRAGCWTEYAEDVGTVLRDCYDFVEAIDPDTNDKRSRREKRAQVVSEIASNPCYGDVELSSLVEAFHSSATGFSLHLAAVLLATLGFLSITDMIAFF
ncbi:hypothetical protein BSKO_06107 [Bryopsis sp. KO-2023]|nr:hypothetical protein BSKO_06107 [Bryopsis sp. KO-2023]